MAAFLVFSGVGRIADGCASENGARTSLDVSIWAPQRCARIKEIAMPGEAEPKYDFATPEEETA
jgi:hypothetical protein